MPEEWKEKERRLLREEKIEETREKIGQIFERYSEEYKESLLKKHTEKIDNDPLINWDFWMADLMKKKYGLDFLTCVSGDLSDVRKVEKKRAKLSKPEKPKLPTGWMCTFCDPEPEFGTSQQLSRHIEVVHPEITTLTCSGSQPAMLSTGRVTQSPATCSGGPPVTPSRGAATHGPSSRSGGQPAKPAIGGATPGPPTYSCGQPVSPQESTTEWQKEAERVDSDLEDLFDDDFFNQVADSPIECSGSWIDPS